MSQDDLIDLLAFSTNFLPDEEVVLNLANELQELQPAGIVDEIMQYPNINKILVTIGGAISDMESEQVRYALIHFIDLYYPRLIKRFAKEETLATKFRTTVDLMIIKAKEV
jgi:hypothetical protein